MHDRRAFRASTSLVVVPLLHGEPRIRFARMIVTRAHAMGLLAAMAMAMVSRVALGQDTTATARDTVRVASMVDSAVRPDPRATASAEYPEVLRVAHISGEVLAEFVVDTLGFAEMSTFRADSSTDPLFTESVRIAVAASRYVPAMLDGRHVRQMVMQPFVFRAPEANSVDTTVSVGVERDAELLPTSPVAEYPAALRRVGVEAIVATRFVVDTTGRVDESTFQFVEVRVFRRVDMGPVMQSEGEQRLAFEEAVRKVLPELRFTPAMAGGVSVRQLVRMPFTFAIPM